MAFGLETNCLGGEDDEFTSYSKKMFKARNMIMTMIFDKFSQFQWVLQGRHFTVIPRGSYRGFTSQLYLGVLQGFTSQLYLGVLQGPHFTVIPPKRVLQGLHFTVALEGSYRGVTSQLYLRCVCTCWLNIRTSRRKCSKKSEYCQEEFPPRDRLSSLTYMEQFINRNTTSLPTIPFVSRKPSPRNLQGTTTFKGSGVLIPISAILMDAKHFPTTPKYLTPIATVSCSIPRAVCSEGHLVIVCLCSKHIIWIHKRQTFFEQVTTENNCVDTENWTKYGVKHVSMFISNQRLGFDKLIKSWIERRIRHIITPSFSTGKLKISCRQSTKEPNVLSQVLEDYARKDFIVPIKHNTGQYTGEIIARTAFGFNSDCLGGEDDEFIFYSKKLLKVQSKIFKYLVPFIIRQEAERNGQSYHKTCYRVLLLQRKQVQTFQMLIMTLLPMGIQPVL
ncbi:hypothetical protein Btru_028819 [Bulinus truncatus]|nr:hypothetical protein Btru_028819 [Bulinus truncatus]